MRLNRGDTERDRAGFGDRVWTDTRPEVEVGDRALGVVLAVEITESSVRWPLVGEAETRGIRRGAAAEDNERR